KLVSAAPGSPVGAHPSGSTRTTDSWLCEQKIDPERARQAAVAARVSRWLANASFWSMDAHIDVDHTLAGQVASAPHASSRARAEAALAFRRGWPRRLILPWAAVGLVVAGLLIPAVTREWSDRPREIDLKTRIVNTLGSATAAATANALLIAENET